MLPQLIALRPACALFGVALDRKLKNLGRASFAAARASWKESEIQKVDPLRSFPHSHPTWHRKPRILINMQASLIAFIAAAHAPDHSQHLHSDEHSLLATTTFLAPLIAFAALCSQVRH
jgi:hypothetical protein